jgi:hypothetical protein
MLELGTGRQRMLIQRRTNPKLSRRTCTCEYGLHSCRGNSAGVAKRPRERPPTRNPYRYDSPLFHRRLGGFRPAAHVVYDKVKAAHEARGGGAHIQFVDNPGTIPDPAPHLPDPDDLNNPTNRPGQ